MAKQLSRIGIFNNIVGRYTLKEHLKRVLNGTSNVLRFQTNGRVLRESLLMGPGGGLKVHSVWEGSKLITLNFFGT